jgi:zinc transporter ZupT
LVTVTARTLRAMGNLPGRRDFAYLNVIGDGVHNFIDGMVIAVSFLAGFQVGVATAIAVIFGRGLRVWGGGP